MSTQDFIRRQVTGVLTKEGYSHCDANTLAGRAVEHYNQRSSFAKGKVFDDCLRHARSTAKQSGISKIRKG